MNSFTVEILDDEGSMCTLYTVRKEGASLSETEKFFSKRKTVLSGFEREFQELTHLLTSIIANKDGALPEYFRDEREANGLPPKGEWDFKKDIVSFVDFPLRLYCLRVSEDKLILFNGDEKTSWKAQDGKTRTTFYEAQIFARKIKEAINGGILDFEEEEIVIY